MNPDIVAEELLAHELDRLRELYVITYNYGKDVTKIGQDIANCITALALTRIAKNGGGMYGE